MTDNCQPAEAADEQGAAAFDVAPSINCAEPNIDTLVPAIQAARIFHRTTRTLRNWESRGLLSGVRIGRSLYFKISDIEQLITGGEAAATAPQSPPMSSGGGASLPDGGVYLHTNSGEDGAA
ncbi:hypothetical protein GCM10010909_16130 [Acidocella aquatica]|uniref:Helix-turn-helix domain-containing protein n=1 Tax=Acidocella aquatica TaxID=1922313 RepID=A0ABQ6A9M6_9PROT|nr:helix-turn-helix domain-containing protein [Acidocella aquatica]GLR66933.1 hypothetical protein GCM10010909_16130 [Acidocella aquatica]